MKRSAGGGASRGMALYEEEVMASYVLRITHENKYTTCQKNGIIKDFLKRI